LRMRSSVRRVEVHASYDAVIAINTWLATVLASCHHEHHVSGIGAGNNAPLPGVWDDRVDASDRVDRR
jgi:hypothetical protein